MLLQDYFTNLFWLVAVPCIQHLHKSHCMIYVQVHVLLTLTHILDKVFQTTDFGNKPKDKSTNMVT